MSQITYNPDILSCLANLSNDEVFTPPSIVNQMLDTLPLELWSDKNIKFLDPVSKSGVFLREITKRLISGLASEIPDLQERLDHILQNQVYGIAITELTALLSRRTLYCSKRANNTKYSIAMSLGNADGNIFFDVDLKHTWKNGSCIYCGASQESYDREESLESHAYAFIHHENPVNLFTPPNMKFDVIIGNPPYQLETTGYGRQAKPIYQLFIEQAKKLSPKYICMITPSRWFSGGFGLDAFRDSMLNDDRLEKIVDFPNAADCFPGVDIAGGVNYFLWNRDRHGLCEVSTVADGTMISDFRALNEFPVFIRNTKAIPIVRKVQSLGINGGRSLADLVSPQKPYGLPTNYKPKTSGVACWFIQRIGLRYAHSDDIVDSLATLNKWKMLIPKAPIAGQTDFSKPVGFYTDTNTRIAKPGECCTESYLVAGAFETEQQVNSFKSYLFTKIVRFLLLQTVVSQDVLRKKFIFIPDLGTYTGEYTDDILRVQWGITDEEWDFIDSRIR